MKFGMEDEGWHSNLAEGSEVLAASESEDGCESCRRLKVMNSALVDVKDELAQSLREVEVQIVDLEEMLCLAEREAASVAKKLEAEKRQILKNLEAAHKRIRLQVMEISQVSAELRCLECESVEIGKKLEVAELRERLIMEEILELKFSAIAGWKRADLLERVVGVLCFLLVVSWCIFFNINEIPREV